MLQFQLWKKLLVALVMLGGVVYALPNLVNGNAASLLPGEKINLGLDLRGGSCLLYTSPSPRDMRRSRMPSSA